jgi:hypothetical protein
MLGEFLEFMRPYWSGVALAATWAGIGIVWWRRRRAWQQKQFLSQVNFSLNYVQDNQLTMRTLLELPATEVWLSEHGSALVAKASKKTAIEEPFIRLKEVKDQDFLNRAVLNALSERFADGFVAAALGLPVSRDQFVFGITCEKYGEIRTLKIRVLLIRERTLVELFGPARLVEKLQPPNVILQARLRTLEMMYQHYQDDQKRGAHVLGRVELGLLV